MTRRQRLTRPAAILTAVAAATAAVATTPAAASTPVPAVAAARPANMASSPVGAFIGTLAYRGAEHPYLVGNLADASKRFGPASAQAKAAAAGLSVNVGAISRLLSGGSAARASSLRGALLARDRGEVAYAAAVLAAHKAGVSGRTAAEKKALAAIGSASRSLAADVHRAAPSISVSAAGSVLAVLNAGDEKALRAAALDQPAQFADVEVGSVSLAKTLVVIGQRASGRPAAMSKAVEYRAALEVAFTEHVYQTGLFGEAVLVYGPSSANAMAAHRADSLNTDLVARLLRDIGSGISARQVWNSHITGYSFYLTNLATGRGSLARAGALFGYYEKHIAIDVHRAAPAVGSVAQLQQVFAMHVGGTLTVFKLEKAGSPKLYPTALMGAAMFADLGAKIAQAQTAIR